jgi:translation initiation factor IF-2
MPMSKNTPENLIERPPVVAVMGHVDHGKSTLLDYIRKSNVVAGEAGGITQHISAYEVSHKNSSGVTKKITFLDTPGHEAFSNMRARGAKAADIAVLVVAADDGVNAQTKEVFETIQESKTPFIVAINKIDKPGANIEKTKNSLLEAGIYIEGYGGSISAVEVSAKTGVGIEDLLETILLTAEIEGLKGDTNKNATGLVIESNSDPKRGISATLVIKDGTLAKGMFVVVDDTISTTRIFEDFKGKNLENAQFSSPVRITGFTSLSKISGMVKIPKVGETFYSFATKKEAEEFIYENKKSAGDFRIPEIDKNINYTIPIIIKTDVAGTSEAIAQAVMKIVSEKAGFKIIRLGVGDISESDLNFAQADKNVLIIGFNVKVERTALDANDQIGATIKTFNIIYELTDWLKEQLEEKRPRVEEKSISGSIKVLKVFSQTKNKLVFGGRVVAGTIKVGNLVDILRRENKIGVGKIVGLQQSKVETKEVQEDLEFGGMIESDKEIAPGDILESFVMIKK